MALFKMNTLSSCIFFAAVSLLQPGCEARLFKVVDAKGDPCILMDVDMYIKFTALKNGKEVATRIVTADGPGIIATGICQIDTSASAIAFFFQGDSTLTWGIVFSETSSKPGQQVKMERDVQFEPKDLFGESVNVTAVQSFYDGRPVYLSDKSHSYQCGVTDTHFYLPAAGDHGGYQFKVKVVVYSIHAQGFGINGAAFGPTETCLSPIKSTTPIKPVPMKSTTPIKPVPLHTTAVKPVPIHPTTPVKPVPIHPTTPATFVPMLSTTPIKPAPIHPTTFPPPSPEAPINMYTVKNGDTTCIILQAGITLIVHYPVKGTRSKFKKAHIQIPASATATGSCSKSPNSQELDIHFFDRWALNIKFTKKTQKQQVGYDAAPTPYRRAYGISAMTLTIKTDNFHFPDSKFLPGFTYTASVASSTAHLPAKAADSDYYKCYSSDTIDMSSNVQIQTHHLLFKAFNTEKSPEFDGKTAECAADKHSGTSIGPGGVVGILFAVIVVIALIVLAAMMYKRRRNNSYNNIQ